MADIDKYKIIQTPSVSSSEHWCQHNTVQLLNEICLSSDEVISCACRLTNLWQWHQNFAALNVKSHTHLAAVPLQEKINKLFHFNSRLWPLRETDLTHQKASRQSKNQKHWEAGVPASWLWLWTKFCIPREGCLLPHCHFGLRPCL